MIECFYEKTESGFRWHTKGNETNSTICIMSKALGHQILLDELRELRNTHKITLEEFLAIESFDLNGDTRYSLRTLKKLAKRYKIKLVKAEY